MEPQIARDHRLHLIEEQLLRDATERAKRVLKPVDQRPHLLTRVKPAPQQPGVAEHDEQGVPFAPWEAELREVDLGLTTRRRLEADDRLRRRRWTDLPHKFFQLRVAACVSRRADLREQPHRRQRWIRRETRLDDGLVVVEFCGYAPSRPIPHRCRVQIPIELAIANPAMNRVAMDAQFARQGAFAGPVLQVVPE